MQKGLAKVIPGIGIERRVPSDVILYGHRMIVTEVDYPGRIGRPSGTEANIGPTRIHDALIGIGPMADRTRLKAVRELLTQTANIDRIAANIAMTRVRPRELVALGPTLRQLPDLAAVLAGCRSELIADAAPDLTGLDEAAEQIDAAIDPNCPSASK